MSANTMKTMTLQKQILDRIRTEGVRPTPRGVFRARDYVLWFMLGVFVLALSIGFGMIIFMLRTTDLDLMARLGLSAQQKILYAVPFFWIIASLAAGAAAYWNLRRMRRGYRVSAWHFGLIAVVIALALGSIVYAFNITQSVDEAASNSIPLYNTVVSLNTRSWFDPVHGLLSGSVKEKDSDNSFTLRDKNFDLWTITGDNITLNPSDFTFRTGDNIKIIGRQTGTSTFQAIEIRPFETPIRKQSQ